MPNLDFSYGVYDSTGELLKGSLRGYKDLARLLDAKGVPLYLESGKEGVLLGCRFIVQIIGGREERALFLAKYPIGELHSDIITKFYERGVLETESLDEVSYEVLGLWEKGDIENIERIVTFNKIYKFVVGKLIQNEKVLVKSLDLFQSLSLLVKVAQELQPVLLLGFKMVVSKSPVEADLLIRSAEQDAAMDLEGGVMRNARASMYAKFYRVYKEHIYGQFGEYRFKGRRELADKINKITFRDYPEDIYEHYSQDMNKLFKFCMDNSDDLISIINRIVTEKKVVRGIEDGTVVELMEKLAPRVYDTYHTKVVSFLLERYKGISDPHKRKLQEFLLEKNIFWEGVMRDALRRIVVERDRKLLHILARKSFTDPKTAKQFADCVRNALLLTRAEALDFLNLTLEELEYDSGEGGQFLVKALYDMLDYEFLKKLNEKNMQKLREFGYRLPSRGVERDDIKNAFVKALGIVIVGLVIFAAGVGVGEYFEPFTSIFGPWFISYSDLSVKPPSGDAPLDITASAMVKNAGICTAKYNATLRVDERVVNHTLEELKAGENRNVSFEYVLYEAGRYNVTIDELEPFKVDVTAPSSSAG